MPAADEMGAVPTDRAAVLRAASELETPVDALMRRQRSDPPTAHYSPP
jgi:hypothetical protein